MHLYSSQLGLVRRKQALQDVCWHPFRRATFLNSRLQGEDIGRILLCSVVLKLGSCCILKKRIHITLGSQHNYYEVTLFSVAICIK